jgi:hypothetical protein
MAVKTAPGKNHVSAENNVANNTGQTAEKSAPAKSLTPGFEGLGKNQATEGMAKANSAPPGENNTGHRNFRTPALIAVVSRPADSGRHIANSPGAAITPADNSISSAALKQTPVPPVKTVYPDIPSGTRVKNTLIHPLSGGKTEFAYNVQAGCDVVIRVYDRNGRPIRNIFSGNQPPGTYTGYWKGDDDTGATVKAGIYVLFMRIGSIEKKVTVGVIE